MTTRTHSPIDPGNPAYWRDRQRAFRLIRDAELAAARLAEAPMYLHGGYDENGDVIPVENLEPEDDMNAAIRAIEADPTAVGILAVQGRTCIGGYAIPSSLPQTPSLSLSRESGGLGKGWGPRQRHSATDGFCVTVGAWAGTAHFASDRRGQRGVPPASGVDTRGRFGGCEKKAGIPITN